MNDWIDTIGTLAAVIIGCWLGWVYFNAVRVIA